MRGWIDGFQNHRLSWIIKVKWISNLLNIKSCLFIVIEVDFKYTQDMCNWNLSLEFSSSQISPSKSNSSIEAITSWIMWFIYHILNIAYLQEWLVYALHLPTFPFQCLSVGLLSIYFSKHCHLIPFFFAVLVFKFRILKPQYCKVIAFNISSWSDRSWKLVGRFPW